MFNIRNTLLVAATAGVLAAGKPAEAAPYAYITDRVAGIVWVIDTATDQVTASVPVPGYPVGVAVNGAGTLVYVTNQFQDSISVIDAAKNRLTATIVLHEPTPTPTPRPTSVPCPEACVEGAFCGVPCLGFFQAHGHCRQLGTECRCVPSSCPTAVPTSTPIQEAYAPTGIAVDPRATRVYVTTSGALSIIDTASAQILATIPLGPPSASSEVSLSTRQVRTPTLQRTRGSLASSG
jgi:YVTN family beta-propeller protein